LCIKLVNEIILYYDARSKKDQITKTIAARTSYLTAAAAVLILPRQIMSKKGKAVPLQT